MNYTAPNPWVIGGLLPHVVGDEGAPSNFIGAEIGSDEYWMALALVEGMKAGGISNPNPSVGCVIVKDGQLITSGMTERYRMRHAERVACEKTSPLELKGSTVYVTLEPCAHQGFQPSCAELLVQNKVARVVIAVLDPNPLVGGLGISKLKDHGINVVVGVLGEAARLWHLPFLAAQVLKRPLLIGKWAETSNGLLADPQGVSKWISGPQSRAYSHWLRHKYDAILVGANTVEIDLPQLTARDCALTVQRQPIRMVLDLRSRLLEISPQLSDSTFSPNSPIVLILDRNANSPKGLGKSVHIARIDSRNPVQEILNWLSTNEAKDVFDRPVQSVYVEGGSQTLNMFLKAEALDVIHQFIGLQEFPESGHRVLFDPQSQKFECVAHQKIESDFLNEYVSQKVMGLIREADERISFVSNRQSPPRRHLEDQLPL